MKISFAHNVQNRHITLRETIESELNYFPDSNIFVAYNDDKFNLNYFNDLKIKFIRYVGNGHKVGCVNGCITSIKETLNDDSNVVIFSHDDVKINPKYIDVVKNNIQQIVNNDVDVICRQPHCYGKNYYMMESFYINKIAAKKLFEAQRTFSNENELPVDMRFSPSPEVWLYNTINKYDVKIKQIIYEHSNNNYNKILAENLGFLHKNAGIRGWSD